jgi:hypothetical protein
MDFLNHSEGCVVFLSGFVYNVYITNQFQNTFARGGGGGGGGVNPLVAVTVNSKETFVPITSENSTSGGIRQSTLSLMHFVSDFCSSFCPQYV